MKIWRLAGVPGMGLAVSVLAGATFACGTGSARLAEAAEGPAARMVVPGKVEPVGPTSPAAADQSHARVAEAATVVGATIEDEEASALDDSE